jgi:hypothetical protein
MDEFWIGKLVTSNKVRYEQIKKVRTGFFEIPRPVMDITS